MGFHKRNEKNDAWKKNRTDDKVDESSYDENKIIEIADDTESDHNYYINMNASEIENDYEDVNGNGNENENENENGNENESQDDNDYNRVDKKIIYDGLDTSLGKSDDEHKVNELETRSAKHGNTNYNNLINENLDEIKQKIFPELQKYLIKRFSLSNQTVATQTGNGFSLESLNNNLAAQSAVSKSEKLREEKGFEIIEKIPSFSAVKIIRFNETKLGLILSLVRSNIDVMNN